MSYLDVAKRVEAEIMARSTAPAEVKVPVREERALAKPHPPRSHVRAIKIFSEVLGAHLWIVPDPTITAPDPERYDAPVYSRAEVERLVEAYKRGEVSPDQLRRLHEVKQTWPGVQVVDGPDPVHEKEGTR